MRVCSQFCDSASSSFWHWALGSRGVPPAVSGRPTELDSTDRKHFNTPNNTAKAVAYLDLTTWKPSKWLSHTRFMSNSLYYTL